MREARVDALVRGDDEPGEADAGDAELRARPAGFAGGLGERDVRPGVEREVIEQVGGGGAQAAGAGEVGEVPRRGRATEAGMALDEARRVERGVREAERGGDAGANQLAVRHPRAVREREAEQAHPVVRVDRAAAGLALGPRGRDRGEEVEPSVRVLAVARVGRAEQARRRARQSGRVSGEVLERDRAADDRRRDREVLGHRIVERDQALPLHVREQQPRERLGDRADLEHGVGGHATAPEAVLTARAHADGDPLKARPHARRLISVLGPEQRRTATRR